MLTWLKCKVVTNSIAFLLAFGAYPVYSQVKIEASQHQVVCHYQNGIFEDNLNSGMWQPPDLLKVFTGTNVDSILAVGSPILGSYRVTPGQITFQPVIAFTGNLPYFATFGDSVIHKFSFSNSDHSQTKLSKIYPTSDTIPENLLKIYLEFTGPMREGEVYDKVHLLGPEGTLVQNPFVRLEPELWDYADHRITLWIDPGRVKRSLGSRETYGPVVVAGTRYQMIIDPDWKDASGNSLAQTYQKFFFVQSADRDRPVTDNWQIETPQAQTRQPLTISFGKPMDFSTSLNAFTVYQSDGQHFPGTASLGTREESWNFLPDISWDPGRYTIVIKSVIEDLAGNNLNRVFDRDILNDPIASPEHEFYQLEFEVASGM